MSYLVLERDGLGRWESCCDGAEVVVAVVLLTPAPTLYPRNINISEKCFLPKAITGALKQCFDWLDQELSKQNVLYGKST